jgi:hypothetical protein
MLFIVCVSLREAFSLVLVDPVPSLEKANLDTTAQVTRNRPWNVT